jgi:uncharacterized protein YbaR (Trm112 family)
MSFVCPKCKNHILFTAAKYITETKIELYCVVCGTLLLIIR